MNIKGIIETVAPKKSIKKKVIETMDSMIEERCELIDGVVLSDNEVRETLDTIGDLWNTRMMVCNKRTRSLDGLDYTELLKAGIGLAGILMILKFEKVDIITSKGFDIGKRIMGV